jgi:hypothetical protein
MSHKFLQNSMFHILLKAIDYDFSKEECAKGCPYCGEKLHSADYPRSPLGVPIEHRQYYEERYSYCCSQCRKRTTTQSVRFFGRRWYPEPLFLLISSLMYGGLNKLCGQLSRLFGITVSKRTVKRWKGWWKTSFPGTSFWRSMTGIVPIEHLRGPFPQKFFSMYADCTDALPAGKASVQSGDTHFAKQLLYVLAFLAPITGGILRGI